MRLQRTSAGLSNLYLFYRVDAVVFVEGGEQTFSFQEVLNGKSNSKSPDIKFWQALFSLFAPGKRCHFRAVGSKASLRQLATKIDNEKVSHAFVCMDRDNDHVTGGLSGQACVIRTFGYSWENDVWRPETVAALFYRLSTTCKSAVCIDPEVLRFYEQLRRDLYWATQAEHILVSNGLPCLNRKGLDNVIRRGTGGEPRVNKKLLRELVKKSRNARRCKCRIKLRQRGEPLADFYGHALAEYAYALLSYIGRKHSSIPSLPKDVVWALGIDTAAASLSSAKECETFHRHQFQNLRW